MGALTYEVDAEFVIVQDALRRLGYLLRTRGGVRLLMDMEPCATRDLVEQHIWDVQRVGMYDRNFVRSDGPFHSFILQDGRGRSIGKGGQFHDAARREAAIMHIKQCVLLAPLVN